MKYLTTILLSILVLSACGPTATEENAALPTDLEGLQAVKKDLQNQLQEISRQLDSVDEKIIELKPELLNTAILVTTDTVKKGDFHHYVEIQSSIQSEEIARLSSEMGGRIISIPVKEGQAVRRGQLLAKVDASQLEKSMAELETAYGLAQDVFQRQKRLWDQNIGSEIQYLEAKNQVERLEKSMESLKNQMSKTSIYSPINGVVETIMNEEGELASPGFPVMQVVDTRRLKVVADLPENYLTAVKRGEKVIIEIPAIEKQIDGKVNLVGQTIDPSNRTFKVEAKIQNPGGILKPNLLAEMHINDYTIEDVIYINADLVQQEVGGKNFVYVVDRSGEKMIARKKYVKIGEAGDNTVVIAEGLNEKDEIIVDGAFGVSDGGEVKFPENKVEG